MASRQLWAKATLAHFRHQKRGQLQPKRERHQRLQTKAQDYYNCMVKEANADNNAIAKSANAGQEEFRNEVSRIQKEAEAGKAKVEKTRRPQ